jgi:hypothetical protein
MDNPVETTTPADPGVAKALADPARREAAVPVVSALLIRRRFRNVLAGAIVDAKREAHANGLTDADIDAELQAWREEPRSWRSFSTLPPEFPPALCTWFANTSESMLAPTSADSVFAAGQRHDLIRGHSGTQNAKQTIDRVLARPGSGLV